MHHFRKTSTHIYASVQSFDLCMTFLQSGALKDTSVTTASTVDEFDKVTKVDESVMCGCVQAGVVDPKRRHKEQKDKLKCNFTGGWMGGWMDIQKT